MQDLQFGDTWSSKEMWTSIIYIQAYYNELGFDMELDDSDKTIYTVQI